MRKILGTVGATLAIAAVAGGWWHESPPIDIPLGDGVDQVDKPYRATSELRTEGQDPPTMVLREGIEIRSIADDAKTFEDDEFDDWDDELEDDPRLGEGAE
jgi:hypothetical protein